MGSALRGTILFPSQAEIYETVLDQAGIHRNGTHRVAVLGIDNDLPSHSATDMHRAVLRIAESTIVAHDWRMVSLYIDGRYVFVFPCSDVARTRAILGELISSCTSVLFRDNDVRCGLGGPVHGTRLLSRSYRQAIDIVRLQEAHKRTGTIDDYEGMGAYRLLLGMEDEGLLASYYSETLSGLERYDSANHTNLLEVLRLYLSHGCSLRAVAERLYVHRNTVSYRLRRAGEVLGRDLSSFPVREELDLAFRAHDILSARSLSAPRDGH